MANLIITIISIALVAVAALMGAYYGGTAFLQGQAKAQANSLINQGQQIAAAWLTYSANNGGSKTITPWSTLVPAYLQATPVNQLQPASSPIITGWDILGETDDMTYQLSGSNPNLNYISIVAQVNDQKVCETIHQMAAGPSATLTDHAGGDPWLAGAYVLPSNGKFDCYYYDADSAYFFVYRVF